MPQEAAPFRADHVGSFLRPEALKEARAKRERGEITAEALKSVEDREIAAVIRKQEEVGLKLATDGEFRRSFWQFDFQGLLDGAEMYQGPPVQFQGTATRARGVRVTGKLGFSAAHPFVEHFKFVQAHTRVMPKMTVPSPSVLHFRLEPDAIMTKEYADRTAVLEDLARVYQQVIRVYYDAGCRYLQLDDTVWAYLCSAEEMAKAKARGLDTATLAQTYARVLNAALAVKPADMAITTHVCRGNFRSTWISSGGYEPVAEMMFGVNYDGFFLEYDTDRAGGFEPLRFVRKGKQKVVLGLVTSKSGALEKKDDIKRRIDEATKFIPLDQCCLSPQCGFASTEEGNILTEEQQWAKLREVVELSDEVWGK